MNNFEIAKILKEIAVFLEMDDVSFRPRAYEKAAASVEALGEDVEAIYKKGGIKALIRITAVGRNIAEKIAELIETGQLQYYNDLKREIPVDLESFAGIEGVGPKTIKILWQKLQIKNIDDLERAVRAHEIRKLPGFKEKRELNLLKGIEFAKKKAVAGTSSGSHYR